MPCVWAVLIFKGHTHRNAFFPTVGNYSSSYPIKASIFKPLIKKGLNGACQQCGRCFLKHTPQTPETYTIDTMKLKILSA